MSRLLCIYIRIGDGVRFWVILKCKIKEGRWNCIMNCKVSLCGLIFGEVIDSFYSIYM